MQEGLSLCVLVGLLVGLQYDPFAVKGYEFQPINVSFVYSAMVGKPKRGLDVMPLIGALGCFIRAIQDSFECFPGTERVRLLWPGF